MSLMLDALVVADKYAHDAEIPWQERQTWGDRREQLARTYYHFYSPTVPVEKVDMNAVDRALMLAEEILRLEKED